LGAGHRGDREREREDDEFMKALPIN
jgi:hypothetical protein